MNVAVAIPSYSRWHPAMGISIASMCARAGAIGINLSILSHSGSEVASVRNTLVRTAQKIKAEWLFFIDDDMIFPRDTLEKLLSHDKDIVGVICSRRTPPYLSIGAFIEPISEHGITRASQLGAGILLIRMSVFDRVPSPWFQHLWGEVDPTENNPDGELSEDLYFIRQAQMHGIEIWCDRDLSPNIGHVGEQILTVAKDQQNGGFGSATKLSEKQGWKKL